MKIIVGSTNPVKINSVIIAATETWPAAEVTGVEVQSGVSEQPLSDQETRQGARNRAKNAFEHDSVDLGIGAEGGVFQREDGELWSTVWVAVWDGKNYYEANGARFRVPKKIADPILRGEEMGPIVSQMLGGADVKREQGAIGVITNNFVDRTEEYSAVVKLALGLWYGRDHEFQQNA